jgi:transcriptional regulator with XRE-family HTH domain
LSASDQPGDEQRQGDPDEPRQGEQGGRIEDPRENPVVAQRRLRTTLRDLRLRQGQRKTQKQVAMALDWSQSKLLRLEGGQVPIATSDLIALLTQYGITDEQQVKTWVDLARASRKPTIKDAYLDIFSKAFAEFVEHEAYASIIRQFETKLIPGVLQTEDYAEAVLRTYLEPTPPDAEVSRRVQARLERAAQLLDRSKNQPEMFFILDEAAVRRQVGRESENPTLMVRQLQHLKEMGSRPNIQIQIVPFNYGIYAALRGPFELLEFDDPADLPMLYVENPQGDELFHENIDKIAPFLDTFTELEESLKKNSAANFDEQMDIIISQMKQAISQVRKD